jgi:hypothetical protein
VCEACQAGSFHNETGRHECRPCRNGTFAQAGALEVSWKKMRAKVSTLFFLPLSYPLDPSRNIK